jgi:hypothetical protein
MLYIITKITIYVKWYISSFAVMNEEDLFKTSFIQQHGQFFKNMLWWLKVWISNFICLEMQVIQV